MACGTISLVPLSLSPKRSASVCPPFIAASASAAHATIRRNLMYYFRKGIHSVHGFMSRKVKIIDVITVTCVLIGTVGLFYAKGHGG